MPEARLSVGLYAARGQSESLADFGPRGLLRGQYVHAHGTRRCELSHEADELSLPYFDLQEFAQELSRLAGALCGVGKRLPLRTLGHHARSLTRTRLYQIG